MSVIVHVAYEALPGMSERARAGIAALVASVLANEPECQGIELLQDCSDPHRILLSERWPSREVFLGHHMQQPHIQAFIAGAGAFLVGPPAISFWASPLPAAN